MDHPYFMTFVLVAGLALGFVAEWRKWRPGLAASLVVGAVLRGVVLATAASSAWQPVDFIQGFKVAGEATLAGQDPVLASQGSWHFLPMIPYFYAMVLWTGIPFVVAGRLCTLIADMVLIVLVGRLASPERRAQARFLYACAPLPLMVSVLHGQLESIALAFLLGSYLAARKAAAVWGSGHGRAAVWWSIGAGVLFGLALSANSWPVILLPVMLSMVPTWRQRLYGLIASGAVPLLFLATLPLVVKSSWDNLLHVMKYLGGVRPVVGEWGWTALLTGGDERLVPGYSRVGQIILYSTLIAVAYYWRKADKIDLTSALLLAFLLVTPRMGSQYLLWFVPFLIIRPTRWSRPAMAVAGLWAAIGYLYLTQFDQDGWWVRHVYWSQGSLVVIPWLALAMPWERRKGIPRTGDKPPGTQEQLVAVTG